MNYLHQKHKFPIIDVEMVKKSLYFAKKYHEGQFRKTGHPFVSHPINVANMCMYYMFKTDVIIVALLHDIVEDTECITEIIRNKFDFRIGEMIYRLTSIRNGKKISQN